MPCRERRNQPNPPSGPPLFRSMYVRGGTCNEKSCIPCRVQKASIQMNRGYAPGLIGKLILHKLARCRFPDRNEGNRWKQRGMEMSNKSAAFRTSAITFEIMSLIFFTSFRSFIILRNFDYKPFITL